MTGEFLQTENSVREALDRANEAHQRYLDAAVEDQASRIAALSLLETARGDIVAVTGTATIARSYDNKGGYTETGISGPLRGQILEPGYYEIGPTTIEEAKLGNDPGYVYLRQENPAQGEPWWGVRIDSLKSCPDLE